MDKSKADKRFNKSYSQMSFQFLRVVFLTLWGSCALIGFLWLLIRNELTAESMLKAAGISAAASLGFIAVVFIISYILVRTGKGNESKYRKIINEFGLSSMEAYNFCMEAYNRFSSRNDRDNAAEWAIKAAGVCCEGNDPAEAEDEFSRSLEYCPKIEENILKYQIEKIKNECM